GINLEGNPTNCAGYTPLCAPDPSAIAQGKLRAQPEWYALLLSRPLVGYRPLPTTVTAEGSPNLVAASFSGPDRSVQVVLVDEDPPGSRPLALRLNAGAGLRAARVMRLTAPSPSATGGVRLAGRAVAADGSWQAPTPSQSIPARAGAFALALSPSSAALVTVSPRTPRSAHAPGGQHTP